MIRPGVRNCSSLTEHQQRWKTVTIIKSQIPVFENGNALLKGDRRGRPGPAELSISTPPTPLLSMPFPSEHRASVPDTSGLKRDSRTSHLTKVTGGAAEPTDDLALSRKGLEGLQEDSKPRRRVCLIATMITWLPSQLPGNKAASRSWGHGMVLKESIWICLLCWSKP